MIKIKHTLNSLPEDIELNDHRNGYTLVCMPQTIAFVSLENNGRWAVTLRASPFAIVVALAVASSTPFESSLFYKRESN